MNVHLLFEIMFPCIILVIRCAYTRAIDRSSHAGYRSILVLTSLTNTCGGQSECRSPPTPIRTLVWSSRLSGQRRILFIQPRGTPEQERHLVISLRRLYFPSSFICPWPSCHLDLGGSRHGWGLFLEQTGYLRHHGPLS